MRLDLSCETEADHNWRLGKNVFSLGCTERHRITLYYQQVRAFNLVYALEKQKLLKPGTRICILGAGPTGVAAASAAAILGAEVVLLEKEHDILGVLRTGNKRRLFHPALDKWPDPAWKNNKADLPLYAWEQPKNLEVSPQDLRRNFLEELRGIQNCPRTRLRVLTGFQGQPVWKDGQWHIELDQCSESHTSSKVVGAPTTTFEAEVLILAFGFGLDKKAEYRDSFGYFDDDSVLWDQIDKLGVQTEPWDDQAQDTDDWLYAISSNTDPIDNTATTCCNQGNITELGDPQIIVSGSGDGALIEAINAVFHSKRNRNGNEERPSLNWLFPRLEQELEGIDCTWKDLLRKLQELEEIIASSKSTFSSEEMLSRYSQLEDCAQHKATLKKVDETLKDTFFARRKVYLFHKGPHYMGVGNFAFLRFLVWRFVSMGLILPRRIEMTPEIYNTWLDNKLRGDSCDLEFSSFGRQWKFPDIRFIIPRHGPSWPFSKHSDNYANLEFAAKRLQELNEQDKTRERIWDDAFTERLKASCGGDSNP